MEILDIRFNQFVRNMAEHVPYVLVDWDYESFADMVADYKSRGHICINTAFSDGTIFGDPTVNYAFRAWHDYCHILANADFTEQGERAAATLQTKQMYAFLGRNKTSNWFARIIDCEVNGQAKHFLTTGEFPSNQLAFACQYLGV